MKRIAVQLLATLAFFGASAAVAQPNVSEFPLTVTDQIGRTVTLKALPKRIVSGYYISSSACLALGLKLRLAALEEKIEVRPIYKLAAPELIGTVGNVGSAKNFDLEACIAAKPDLVILPKRGKDYAATLAEMDVPVLVVNPENHRRLVEMITLIGRATGTADAAKKLIARYDEISAKVKKLTAAIPDGQKPSVYLCSPASYLSTAPRDMYQASLIASAGGKNAGSVLDGDSWTKVSYEQILAMNPDVIIIPTNNMASGQPGFTAAEISADEHLAEVKAVKNGMVYNMPTGFEAWDSPVPSGVLGMLWMVSALHPKLYSAAEFAADAANFYKTFYGFDMDASNLAPQKQDAPVAFLGMRGAGRNVA